jgi:hypothetical protein
MLSIPLQPVPSQSTKVILDGQNCQILINQRTQGIFVDVNVNGVDIVTSVIARDAVPIVCRDYAGFAGNLLFIDNMGNSDPSFEGLGDRYSLVYLTAAEYDLV